MRFVFGSLKIFLFSCAASLPALSNQRARLDHLSFPTFLENFFRNELSGTYKLPSFSIFAAPPCPILTFFLFYHQPLWIVRSSSRARIMKKLPSDYGPLILKPPTSLNFPDLYIELGVPWGLLFPRREIPGELRFLFSGTIPHFHYFNTTSVFFDREFLLAG